jgi:hypothetical protein
MFGQNAWKGDILPGIWANIAGMKWSVPTATD